MTKLLIALAWILLGGIAAFASFKGIDKMYEELYFKKLSPEKQTEILNKLENDTTSFEKMGYPEYRNKRDHLGHPDSLPDRIFNLVNRIDHGNTIK